MDSYYEPGYQSEREVLLAAELEEIAEAGAQAYFDGGDIDDCPYSKEDSRRRYFAWSDGFSNAAIDDQCGPQRG